MAWRLLLGGTRHGQQIDTDETTALTIPRRDEDTLPVEYALEHYRAITIAAVAEHPGVKGVAVVSYYTIFACGPMPTFEEIRAAGPRVTALGPPDRTSRNATAEELPPLWALSEEPGPAWFVDSVTGDFGPPDDTP